MMANCAEPMLFGPVLASVATEKGKARFTELPEGAIEYVTAIAVMVSLATMSGESSEPTGWFSLTEKL